MCSLILAYYCDCSFSYCVDFAGVEHLEGNGGEEVEEEPGAHVVDGDEARVVDHLTRLAHVRRAEIQHDICI